MCSNDKVPNRKTRDDDVNRYRYNVDRREMDHDLRVARGDDCGKKFDRGRRPAVSESQ